MQITENICCFIVFTPAKYLYTHFVKFCINPSLNNINNLAYWFLSFLSILTTSGVFCITCILIVTFNKLQKSICYTRNIVETEVSLLVDLWKNILIYYQKKLKDKFSLTLWSRKLKLLKKQFYPYWAESGVKFTSSTTSIVRNRNYNIQCDWMREKELNSLLHLPVGTLIQL